MSVERSATAANSVIPQPVIPLFNVELIAELDPVPNGGQFLLLGEELWAQS